VETGKLTPAVAMMVTQSQEMVAAQLVRLSKGLFVLILLLSLQSADS
jgi:hypothetical protein